MKANELRFGVWVTDTYADGERYETQVTIKQLEYPHNCEGIPLTEDWLKKFGFEIQYKTPYYDMVARKEMLNLCWEKKGFYWIRPDIHFEIKTVHQLQNLYFALTGEELTR